MFVVLYRWKLRAGMEEQFVSSWSEVTKFYLDNFDSLGSRLHQGDDGIWYGYAQWKSRQQRTKAFEEREILLTKTSLIAASVKMSEAVLETLPEIQLQIASDHLLAK
ncbi:MAG: antibiotic biosynthesis monooxygenase [Acidobacteria bacterium]|nr:antibiotic biosynthesis monooxygenase [Acidobacteriota bacterium]